MAETLQVVITGKDGVSRVFKEISQSADSTGKAVEKAGERGERGFRRVGKGAADAKVGVDDLGAALTILGSGLAYAGDRALDQQQTIIGLRKAYGDAADEYIAFADAIADNSIFNDDDIMRGQRYFATLRNNYDLTDQQIKQLMQTTADLASSYSVSFEDASSRITAAIRGEGEAAEYLGLTMNQQSIDRQNLTLTMSNQEAAQFRLNALYQQTGVYSGAAQELAESEVGARARLTNAIQDNAQALGEFIGPLGSMVGGLGLAASGIGGLAGAFGGLGRASRWLVTSPVGLAVTGLVAGVGALGLALLDSGDDAAAAEAAYDSLRQSVEHLDDAISQARLTGDFALARDLEAMNLTVESGLASVSETYAAWRDDFEHAFDNPDTMRESVTAFLDTGVGQAALEWARDNRGVFEDIPDDILDAILAGNEDAIGRNIPVVRSIMEAYYNEFAPSDADKARINEEVADIFDLMGNKLVDQEQLISDFNDIWSEFGTTGDVDKLISDLDALEQQTESTLEQMNALADIDYLKFRGQWDIAEDVQQLSQLQTAVSDVNEVLTKGEQTAYAEGWDAISEAIQSGEYDADRIIGKLRNLEYQLASNQITQRDYAIAVVQLSLNLDDYATATDKATDATTQYAAGLSLASGAADRFAAKQERLLTVAEAMEKGLQSGKDRIVSQNEAIIAAGEAYQDFLEKQQAYIDQLRELAGMDDPLSLSASVSDMTAVANAARDAADSLDTVFRVIVSNTDAIGNQVDGVQKWAEALIGAPGTVAKLDDAYSRWVEDAQGNTVKLVQAQQLWNDAQNAQISIAESNAAIQEDIIDIQLKQSPLIAEQTAALESQYDAISKMPAEQQLVSLGWMDATEAGKAFEFQQLAIKAASGEMGTAGAEAFENYITGAAEADPVLKAMLVDMGLIKESSDGALSFNTDGLQDAKSDVMQLRDTVADLIDVMDDGLLNKSYSVDVEGVEDVEAAKDSVLDLVNAPDKKDFALHLTMPDGFGGLPGAAGGLLNRLLGGGGEAQPAASVPITLDVDDSALDALRNQPPIEQDVQLNLTGLGSSAGGGVAAAAESALGQVQQSVSVQINAIDNASPVIGDVISLASSVDGYPANVAIGAIDNASPTIGDVISFMAQVNGYTSTTIIDANDLASPTIGDAVNFLSSVDGYTGTMAVNAVDNASPVIADAVSLLSSIDGYTATTYLNIVTNRVGGNRHGGIAGYAHGGVIAELGEAGPEMLHFASGGVMPIYQRGIYAGIPENTYVSPANANPSMNTAYGGDTHVHIHVQGNIYGTDDLIDAMASSAEKFFAGHGGAS